MIVAIQQPEHLPWIGFFNKMQQCDLYVYLDNVQFKKRYFENRNRIKTKEGIKWLTVPVKTKGKYEQKINEVFIDNSDDWPLKYFRTLEHACKKSKFWNVVEDIVRSSFKDKKEKLLDLNLMLIEKCRNYLNINTKTVLASTLGVDDYRGSDIILQICLKLKASVYISGTDGRNYLELEKFKMNGIKVIYHDFVHPVYPQMYGEFASHLSVVDIIANCGVDSLEIIRNSYKVDVQ